MEPVGLELLGLGFWRLGLIQGFSGRIWVGPYDYVPGGNFFDAITALAVHWAKGFT